jgi:hypothetical protein
MDWTTCQMFVGCCQTPTALVSLTKRLNVNEWVIWLFRHGNNCG